MWATPDGRKELMIRLAQLEAQQLLHVADIQRAHTAGQGQALRALLEEFYWARDNLSSGGLRLDHIEGWAMDKLKELGEEPREEGAIP